MNFALIDLLNEHIMNKKDADLRAGIKIKERKKEESPFEKYKRNIASMNIKRREKLRNIHYGHFTFQPKGISVEKNRNNPSYKDDNIIFNIEDFQKLGRDTLHKFLKKQQSQKLENAFKINLKNSIKESTTMQNPNHENRYFLQFLEPRIIGIKQKMDKNSAKRIGNCIRNPYEPKTKIQNIINITNFKALENIDNNYDGNRIKLLKSSKTPRFAVYGRQLPSNIASYSLKKIPRYSSNPVGTEECNHWRDNSTCRNTTNCFHHLCEIQDLFKYQNFSLYTNAKLGSETTKANRPDTYQGSNLNGQSKKANSRNSENLVRSDIAIPVNKPLYF